MAYYEAVNSRLPESFGEGIFRALFESIELDQMRWGVGKVRSVGRGCAACS